MVHQRQGYICVITLLLRKKSLKYTFRAEEHFVHDVCTVQFRINKLDSCILVTHQYTLAI